MMLEMNYLQKPEEKQDPVRKTSEESNIDWCKRRGRGSFFRAKEEEVHLQDRAKAASEEFLTNLHSHLFSIK